MVRNISRVLAPLLAVSLLLGTGGAVAAAEPHVYVIDVWSCRVSDELGNPVAPDRIPSGSEIVLFEGWLAKTSGQVVSFVNNVTWVLTVNGQPVDVTPTLTGPIPFGPWWADLFFYSIGPLGRHQTLNTHYDNVLKAASFDGYVLWPAGSVYGGGVDCSFSSR